MAGIGQKMQQYKIKMRKDSKKGKNGKAAED